MLQTFIVNKAKYHGQLLTVELRTIKFLKQGTKSQTTLRYTFLKKIINFLPLLLLCYLKKVNSCITSTERPLMLRWEVTILLKDEDFWYISNSETVTNATIYHWATGTTILYYTIYIYIYLLWNEVKTFLQNNLLCPFTSLKGHVKKSSFVPLPLDLSQHLWLLCSILFCGFIWPWSYRCLFGFWNKIRKHKNRNVIFFFFQSCLFEFQFVFFFICLL